MVAQRIDVAVRSRPWGLVHWSLAESGRGQPWAPIRLEAGNALERYEAKERAARAGGIAMPRWSAGLASGAKHAEIVPRCLRFGQRQVPQCGGHVGGEPAPLA